MKGLILAVVLMSGCSKSPQPKPNSYDFTKSGEEIAINTGIVLKPAESFEILSNTEEILTIHGGMGNYPNFHNPTNVQDVIVILTDVEGKKWKANWVKQ